MIKVESVLKWTVEGSLLKKLKMIRAQILSKNSDAVAIPDKDLHVILAAGSEWEKLRSLFEKFDFSEPNFHMDIEMPFKSIERSNKKSWYVKMKLQQDWKDYTMDLFQGNPDPGRIFHINLANLSGNKIDSVPIIKEQKNHHNINPKKYHKKFKDFRKRY